MDNQTKLTQFAEHLKQADGLLITAGAGMGVDSGLPDFRGAQGFWKAYPPLKHRSKIGVGVLWFKAQCVSSSRTASRISPIKRVVRYITQSQKRLICVYQ